VKKVRGGGKAAPQTGKRGGKRKEGLGTRFSITASRKLTTSLATIYNRRESGSIKGGRGETQSQIQRFCCLGGAGVGHVYQNEVQTALFTKGIGRKTKRGGVVQDRPWGYAG